MDYNKLERKLQSSLLVNDEKIRRLNEEKLMLETRHYIEVEKIDSHFQLLLTRLEIAKDKMKIHLRSEVDNVLEKQKDRENQLNTECHVLSSELASIQGQGKEHLTNVQVAACYDRLEKLVKLSSNEVLSCPDFLLSSSLEKLRRSDFGFLKLAEFLPSDFSLELTSPLSCLQVGSKAVCSVVTPRQFTNNIQANVKFAIKKQDSREIVAFLKEECHVSDDQKSFQLAFLVGKPGIYIVTVLLYDQHIGNSPLPLHLHEDRPLVVKHELQEERPTLKPEPQEEKPLARPTSLLAEAETDYQQNVTSTTPHTPTGDICFPSDVELSTTPVSMQVSGEVTGHNEVRVTETGQVVFDHKPKIDGTQGNGEESTYIEIPTQKNEEQHVSSLCDITESLRRPNSIFSQVTENNNLPSKLECSNTIDADIASRLKVLKGHIRKEEVRSEHSRSPDHNDMSLRRPFRDKCTSSAKTNDPVEAFEIEKIRFDKGSTNRPRRPEGPIVVSPPRLQNKEVGTESGLSNNRNNLNQPQQRLPNIMLRLFDNNMKPSTSIVDFVKRVPMNGKPIAHVTLALEGPSRGRDNMPTVFNPIGICLLSDKRIVVASTFENKVKMFSPGGEFMKEVMTGDKKRLFGRPSDMVALNSGSFVVRDNKGIMLFNNSGDFIQSIRCDQINQSYGLAEDKDGLLVTINENKGSKVQLGGTRPGEADLLFFDVTSGTLVKKIALSDVIKDKRGSKCRFLTSAHGKLYITDLGLDCVYILDPITKGVSVFGQSGSGPDRFSDPAGLVVDSLGNMMVADSKNHRVCLYSRSEKYLGEVPLVPKARRPSGLLLDKDNGDLYLLNLGGHQPVVRYSLQA